MQVITLNHALSVCPDRPKPEPGPDEALIRLNLAGICATDLELTKGYAGFSGVLGHEFVGTVEKVTNPEHRHWLAKRVVGSINIGCGHCATCLSDGPAHCRQRTVLGIRGRDGVFADYFTLPVGNLYPVPEEVADEAAVFAEPLAAAVRAVEQLQTMAVTRVAVIGPGRLGLLIAKALALAAYDVTVLGRSEASLALAQRWQLKTGLIQAAADNGFGCVVDASGQPAGFRQALRIIRPRGVLLLKSTFAALEPIDLSKVVVAELTLLGSRCGPFADALTLLQQQRVPVADLIDGRYPLSQGLAAFAHAARPGVRKILLHP